MTEEQANEIATRLTVALIESKLIPSVSAGAKHTHGSAEHIAALLLSIRDGCLHGTGKQPRA